MSILLYLSLFSIISLFLSYSPFSYFIPQLIAFLTFLTIILNFKKHAPLLVSSTTLVLVTTIISLLIFSTGALASPLFFLLYFLLFFIAFLYPPPVTLSFTIIYILLLSPSLTSESSVLSLLSLLLVTPSSIFFSRQYLKLLSQQNKILILKKKLKKEEQSIQSTETDILLWTSLNLKSSLQNVLDSLSSILPLSSHIQKQELKKTQSVIQKLLKQSTSLAKKIDQITD